MRETRFIEQNKKKWTEFEQLLEKKQKDPDKLSELFIQITDDLSYSRTYYPNRSVRVYLNGLAQQLFYNIYKDRRNKWSAFKEFWTDTLPRVIWETRMQLLLAFLIFWLAFGIGMFSSIMDSDFIRAILGEGYVRMTEANIEGGDPMAVYKQMNEVDMFLGITFNNLKVDFLAFLFGVFFGVGTIGILVFNGIMIGAFQYFFVERDLFWESFLTIWTHGTLEVSAIIISAAAGIVLGRGLAFPGTLSRLQAFQLSARQGLRILLGVIPITIAAGFIEGFLTRYTDAPDWLRLIFILLCLGFVVFYFIVYPYRLAKQGAFKVATLEDRLPPSKEPAADYQKVKTAGEIFLDTFTFFRMHARRLLLTTLVLSILAVVFYFTIMGPGYYEGFMPMAAQSFLQSLAPMQAINLFEFRFYPLLMLANTALFSLLFCLVGFLLSRESATSVFDFAAQFKWKEFGAFLMKKYWGSLLVVGLSFSILFADFNSRFPIAILLFPFAAMWLYTHYQEKANVLVAFGRSLSMIRVSFINIIVTFLILFVIGFLAFLLIKSPFTWLYFEFISWGFNLDGYYMELFIMIGWAFFNFFVTGLILLLTIASMGYVYFSAQEIHKATSIFQKIETLGVRKRAFGMEQEA
ncbi:MAG: stage II sporulation protein M [Bacteroidota bacterium]